jgi:sulfur-oxidizing protein SoxA
MKRLMMSRIITLVFGTCLLAAGMHAHAIQSGYAYIKPETRALQDDDFANPGLLTVDRGNELFNTPMDGATKACAGCHGEDGEDFDVASLARFPKYDRKQARIVTLQDRLISCSEATGRRLGPDDPDRIALETFTRHLALGEPVNVDGEGLDAVLAEGEQMFNTRYGLIDMSCQHCHGFYPGKMVRGQRISEGMGNGFPAYRLDIGEMTTLQERIQQCLVSMRAEPFASGSDELRTMEFYMMHRSNGLPIETPAVRY